MSPGALGSPGCHPGDFGGSKAGPIGDRVFLENAIVSPAMIWGSLGGLVDLGCGVGVTLVTLGGICEWPWEFLEEV